MRLVTLALFLALAAAGVWAQTDTVTQPIAYDGWNSKGGQELWVGEKAPHYSSTPTVEARKNGYVFDSLRVMLWWSRKAGGGVGNDTIMRQIIYIDTIKADTAVAGVKSYAANGDTIGTGRAVTVKFLRNISWCVGMKTTECDTCGKRR